MPVLKENTIFDSRYELLKFLGEGGFAEVWLAKDSLTETEVAVKIFVPDGGLNDEIIGSFKKEFAITLNLNHSHLLKYLHFDIYNKSPYLVMKYCSNGTLFKKIGNNLGEADVAKIMFQIGSALEYLHEMGVAHQDIKPENILTDEHGTYLLSDFGISIKTRNTLNRFTKQATEKSSYGSPPYAPPEKYGKNPKQNLEAGDIFALGVMLYEICEGDLPWGGQGGIALIKGAEVPEIDNPEFTNLFKQLINRCMSVNPADRPTAAELKSKAEFYLREGYWQSEQIKVQPEEEMPKPEPPKPKTSRETTRLPGDEEIFKSRPTDRMPQAEKPVVADKVDLPIDEPVKKKSKTLLFSVIGAVILCFVLVWGLNSKSKPSDEAKTKRVQDSVMVADSVATAAAAVTNSVVDTTAINPAAQQAKKEPAAVVVSKPVIETETPAPAEPVKATFKEPKMVFVQGGAFNMGGHINLSEKPIHSVTVSDFYIGKYELTQKEWKAIMDSNPSDKNYGIGDNNPVNMVNGNDCQEFINKLNTKTGKKYRLPTEAEWEYAARGGNKSRGYEYSGSDNLGSVGLNSDNSGYETHPVGQKQANELGIYDMTGNVWEWCSDWYRGYSSDSEINPQGASSGYNRVIRGGSFNNLTGDCRVTCRFSRGSDGRDGNLGFRLVLSP